MTWSCFCSISHPVSHKNTTNAALRHEKIIVFDVAPWPQSWYVQQSRKWQLRFCKKTWYLINQPCHFIFSKDAWSHIICYIFFKTSVLSTLKNHLFKLDKWNMIDQSITFKWINLHEIFGNMINQHVLKTSFCLRSARARSFACCLRVACAWVASRWATRWSTGPPPPSLWAQKGKGKPISVRIGLRKRAL